VSSPRGRPAGVAALAKKRLQRQRAMATPLWWRTYSTGVANAQRQRAAIISEYEAHACSSAVLAMTRSAARAARVDVERARQHAAHAVQHVGAGVAMTQTKSLHVLISAALLVACSQVACSQGRTAGERRTNDRQLRAQCYSLITFGARTGVVVDLDDTGRVLVDEGDPGGAFVWRSGKMTEMAPLGTASGVDVTDMNNRGEVVGASGSSAVLWRDGVPLGISTSGVRASANAINDLGHVVGGRQDNDGLWHAFMFRDGATTELAAPGRSVVAKGINATDDVVAYEITEPEAELVRGLLFRKGALVELGDGFIPGSLQINARGQVLGTMRGSDGHLHAMLWTDGALRDLAPGRGRDVWAARLNDRGEVVGGTHEVLTEFPFGTVLPFKWSGGVFTALPVTALAGAPFDLDERGNVVGHLYWRTGSRAALWNDGGASMLPDLSGPGALHPHAVANRINESGVIAGSDWNSDGVRQPFVLLPDQCPGQSPPDAGPTEPPPEEPTE